MVKKNEHINLLTAEGYDKIKKEIEHREKVLRLELAETLNEMRSQGDLSENDGYTLAVEENSQNEEEIGRLKELLKNSKIIKSTGKKKVNLGSKVTLECDGKKEKIYTIVGEDNANPMENKISYKSPIGEAIIDKKIGDSFQLQTPKGKIKCKIKAID
jgi:transcription elongation factor GreA